MIDELEARTGMNIENRGRHWLKGVARLQPEVDVQSARAELDVIARRGASPGANTENRGFHLERAGQINPRLRGMAVTFVSVTLGVTALVLLTACVNVAVCSWDGLRRDAARLRRGWRSVQAAAGCCDSCSRKVSSWRRWAESAGG